MDAPAELDPAFAAISEPVSSCINAQEKGEIGLGDTVVIIGAGPIGCIHAALARTRGADRVIMIDILAERLQMAEVFEPDVLINAREIDPVAEVRKVTRDKGAEVIVTATPAPVAQVQAVQMARKGGRILLFGGLPKDKSRPGIDMNVVHYQALHLIGTTIFAPRHQRMALALMVSGRIPMDRLITHTFALRDFEQGVALAMAGKVLKAVFLPT
jgi:L-iditol 2-dehydrogenase